MSTEGKAQPLLDRISDFYDDFHPRLLRDYVYGNSRVNAAIARVCRSIRKTQVKLLDVGCGIGHASAEIAARLPWTEVHAVDISPNSIDIANRLFSSDRVRFEVSAMESVPAGGPFDAIVLIDMYEHVPRINWPHFNGILRQCLTPAGIVILTTPSYLHQEYLAHHKPEQLQVVDETLSLDDIRALEREIDGTLVSYEFMSIWKTNDYVHVVIDRDPQYTSITPKSPRSTQLWQRIRSWWNTKAGADVRARMKHVRAVLGTEVSPL